MTTPLQHRAAPLCALAVLLFTTNALGQPKEAPEEESEPITYTYTVDHDQLAAKSSAGDTQIIPLPCLGIGMLVDTDRIYVACGERGAVVLSLNDPALPKVIDRRDMGGTVTGFFKVDGKVWAQLIKIEAQPVEQGLKPSPIVGTTPPPEESETPKEPETAPIPVGTVVEVKSGEAIIDLGAKDGLERGQKIEIFVQTTLDLGDGEAAVRETLAAVGKISALSEGRAVVKLGLGERVVVGAMARPSERKITNKRLAPPRIDDVWEVAFNLRPFLALSTFGFGMVSDGSIGLRTESGLHLLVLIEPLGIGFAEEGNIVATAANAVVAYDSHLFEVGLGLGLSAVNDSIEDSFSLATIDEDGNGIGTEFERVRSGLSIVQTIRLGAVDGLNLKANNAFLFYQDEFHYGGTNAQLQIPVSDTSWLILGGGGGVSGYGYGEIGLRVLLMGNGDRGSLFITPRLGGAGLFGEVEEDVPIEECAFFRDGDKCIKEIEYGGPMMGIGAEYRF